MSTTPLNPTIKTDIFDFCQSFAGILKPFAMSLEATRTGIQAKCDAKLLQRPMAGFSDVHHRLESLVHKVEEQQAYLIIFGPLKSGKSTLMNAISAAYVSEVTSLPAYPCLVHVKHGDDFSFVASRYSGEKLTFPDNASLQALIEQSHQKLAERLREVEERGEIFDPGVHYPDAIRRVEVAVPTRNMKDSATVLVDTPGLYTRMKFGYDLMTREFRNSAACAVFVVKTDNLFLEQVFKEFNELLDLFSRIFIVVNIDTNKRDLEPDGSLKPSLESRSPGEVIRAFESLVMSAPLCRAQEQGRLKIYPIDLLNSASAAMKRAMALQQSAEAPTPPDPPDPPDPSDPSDPTDPAAAEPSEMAPATGAEQSEAAFAVFLKDLTDYLNSSDYLHEFMGDALLMGANLSTEVQNHCSPEATASLTDYRKVLEAELDDTQARLATVEKLAALDVKASLTHLRDESQKHAQDVSKGAVGEALQKSLKQLEDWFDSDSSVAALQHNWAALIDSCGKRVHSECQLKLHSQVAGPLGGIRIDESLRAAAVGLDELLNPVVAAVRATLGQSDPALQSVSFRIEPEHLKVSKSLWDWLTFRSLAAVRRKIFGRPDAPDRDVPAMIKARRLGENGKQALEERIIGELSHRFPAEAMRLSDAMLHRYMDSLGNELNAKLLAAEQSYAARLADLTEKIDDIHAIRQAIDELSRMAGGVLTEVDKLGTKYHSHSRVTGPAARALQHLDNDAQQPAPADSTDSPDSTPAALPADGECGEENDGAEADTPA